MNAGADAATSVAIAGGSPPDFDEAFAQVDEMALDLRFAGAAQIRLRDGDAVERVVAEDALVRADDLAVFQRERIERGAELRLRQDERRRDLVPVPSRGVPRARLEVGDAEAADQRQAGRAASPSCPSMCGP